MIRPDVVRAARGWLGTPYRHQASLKGVGCDCVGLVRGVWREVVGPEPEPMPAYRPDWAEAGGPEMLLDSARRHLTETAVDSAEPGCVLLFRMAPGARVKHCAVLSDAGAEPRLLHAYWGRAVVESRLVPWWRARLTHAFAFPAPRPSES